MLKIATSSRKTSWLFTKREGIEFGTTEEKALGVKEEDWSPGLPDYKSSAQITKTARLQKSLKNS